MRNNLICFSDSHDMTKQLFTDYINDYLTNVEHKEGLAYDNTISFSEKEKKMNKIMLDEVKKLSGFSVDNITNEAAWATNPVLNWAGMAVINSLVDMIIPDIIIRDTGIYSDVRVGEFGDSFKFDVEPNDLFFVSKAGRDQRTVEFQRQYNSTVTVNPENREITVAVNFYKVLCGMESLAKLAIKAALSMESAMNVDIYKAFDTAMSALPTTPVDQELNVTGWDETSAVKLAEKVSAWNRSRAVFMGTPLALRNILPKDANYRYFLESDFVKVGYIRNFMGYDTLVMPQIADWSNPYKTMLDDNKIYVISPASQKIVKLCLEGSTISRTLPHEAAADLYSTNTMTKSWGVGIATNAIAGVITLA